MKISALEQQAYLGNESVPFRLRFERAKALISPLLDILRSFQNPAKKSVSSATKKIIGLVFNRVDQEDLKEAYGLFQQSQFGDCPSKVKGSGSGYSYIGMMFDMNKEIENMKRMAWQDFLGMKVEEAKKKYVDIIHLFLNPDTKDRGYGFLFEAMDYDEACFSPVICRETLKSQIARLA